MTDDTEAPMPPSGASEANQGATPPPWPPAGPGYGQPPEGYGTLPDWSPAPARQVNPWAITALVTGLCAMVPIAIGAAITALVQIHRRGQAGTPLAIIGLVASALWTLGFVLVVGVVVIGAVREDLTPTAPLGTTAESGSPLAGTCLLEPERSSNVATPVDCATPHDGEVFLVAHLEGDWPGDDVVEKRADQRCHDAFEGYVGERYRDSSFDINFFLPSREEWAVGEHRVVCVLLSGLSRTGSARGSGSASS